ncbi:hypothetical protein D3C83_253480 [compost metagenome]
MDVSGGGEEFGEKLLGFARSRHLRREACGKFGLRVRARDAHRVDEQLHVVGVLHEPVGELGLFERSMARRVRAL